MVLALRAALDAAGFSATQLILADSPADPTTWDPRLREGLQANATFRDAVYGVGLHYPCDRPLPDVVAAGRAVWASEDWWGSADAAGAACWARTLNTNFLRMNASATIAWSLVWPAS